jgi:signal transduction histidine kinase
MLPSRGIEGMCVVPRPALRIALIEPEPAQAAELGQLLSDTLQDYAFEISEARSADLILVDELAAQQTIALPAPAIRFARSPDGSYRACSLHPFGAEVEQTFALAMPLTDTIRCTALLWNIDRNSASEANYEDAPGEGGRLQQRLVQLQKMEAVTELAGGIAHDFNNLLRVIRSDAEMVLEEKDLSSAVRHHNGEILAAARRAGELTRELLAFSRRSGLQLKPTSLNGVIDSSVPMLSRVVGKSISVWVQLLPDLWPVQADAAQLEQVLMNLASNARDAMPNGGKFLIETTNASIVDEHAAMPKGDYVALAVSDTGLGIPRHVLPRIFEPFFTTKERGKGTGLGLASVYGIVRQSGGHIWAYSESGYGTTFKIYLPRATAAALPPEKLTARNVFAEKKISEKKIAKLPARHATNSKA